MAGADAVSDARRLVVGLSWAAAAWGLAYAAYRGYYALGGTAHQTSLGTWSDGVPVRPMTVSTTKPACPAGSGAKGC